jgi:hypothetical protein
MELFPQHCQVPNLINTILTPPDTNATQMAEQRVRGEQQRVIDETPILTILRITNAPPIIQVCNPMSKRALKKYTTNTQARHKEQHTWWSTCDQ